MHEKKFTCMKKIFTCITKISHACQKVHMHEKKISHALPKFHMLVKKFTCMWNSQKLHMHVNLSEFHMVPCFHTLFTCLSHDFHTHTPSSGIRRYSARFRRIIVKYIYIYIYIYIYSLKESEDGQLLTIKKLKNLIKNKNVSVRSCPSSLSFNEF